MTDKEPQPPIIPNFEVDRDAALSWISSVSADVKLDELIVSPEGAATWQKVMGEHLHDVPEDQREDATKRLRQWYQPQLNADPTVHEKNTLLAVMAQEVEVELSANGTYLRMLLSGLRGIAYKAEDPEVTTRSQFMGLWVAR